MNKTGLYIHIPFCTAKCDYCSFYSVPISEDLRKTGLITSYVHALIKEIQSRSIEAEGSVDSIFFGGGTPSFLQDEDLRLIMQAVKSNYRIDDNAEITIEMNPSSLTDQRLAAFKTAGFNRFSLGVQTLDEELYSLIGRKGGFCSKEKLDSFFAVEGVQHCIDIIAGIPGHTPEKLIWELETILTYNPDHISMYMLTLEEGTPLAKRMTEDASFELQQKEVFAAGRDFLCMRGYEHYEVSSFALPDRRSRHNMKYWTFQPYIGFGPGAHSFMGGKRFSNKQDLFLYLAGCAPEEDVSAVNLRMAEFIMTSLRLAEGFTTKRFIEIFGENFPDSIFESALKLARDGSILLHDEGDYYTIAVKKDAFFITDSVIFTMVESLL